MSENTTWRKLIKEAMVWNLDQWGFDAVCTLDDAGLDTEFCDGWGAVEGQPFTLWTKDYVYFPVVYDGSEWVGSVARNPNGKPTAHIGGQ